MCLTFHVRVVHFFGMLKKISFTRKYLLTFTNFSLGLPNMGAQIRCVQNRYIAVQTDLKYPCSMQGRIIDL